MKNHRMGRVAVVLLVLALGIGGALWYWSTIRCCEPRREVPPPAALTGELVLPSDFALTVHNGTGSIVPPSQYSYQLHIDGAGRAELAYFPGSHDSLAVRDTFRVERGVIDSLARRALPLRIGPSFTSERQIVDGGTPLSLTITADGKSTDIDPYELPVGWFGAVSDIAAIARASIPDSVWQKCLAAQSAYGSSLASSRSSDSARR